MCAQYTLANTLGWHQKVFELGLGTINSVETKLCVNPQAQPAFFKAATVPFTLQQKIKAELERLKKQGVIMPQAAKLEVYPLPCIEDLLASLAKGKAFMNLDLSHAYLQLHLDEASQKYVIVNTHRGLFQYKRLLIGVASTSAIF